MIYSLEMCKANTFAKLANYKLLQHIYLNTLYLLCSLKWRLDIVLSFNSSNEIANYLENWYSFTISWSTRY
jgi:hypothetical protein